MSLSRPYDFAWFAAGATFCLRDARAVAPGQPAAQQIEAARQLLASADEGVVVAGALPFDFSEPGSLWLGKPVEIPPVGADRLAARASVVAEEGQGGEAHFEATVRSALGAIDRGELEKVVPARYVDLIADDAIDVAAVAERLTADAAAVTFASRLGDAYWVGASPEILVQQMDARVLSRPLAGSRSRDEFSEERASESLLETGKDRSEHQLVVDEIRDTLAGVLAGPVEVEGPTVRGTTRMWHLATEIGGDIDPRGTDSLTVVEAIHPTAAVCGSPRDAAREFIAEHQHESRGLYAGAVGWQGRYGDGEWRVTLRCGHIDGNRARLYAGAGIVEGSDPRAELEETSAKMRTMRDAL